MCQGICKHTCIRLYGPGSTRIHFARSSSDSSDVPRAGREKERSLWNGVVSHSVEFHRMWGETRIAYSCFLPDTEGGRWRAKERKERKREGGRGRARESSPLCDVHWCSCSSRSNAASVLCSSSSRLPSAPLNYSQPEDVQCGCLLPSSLLLHSTLLSVSLSLFPIPPFFSHVTACFRGSEQKFLLASWLIPPTPPHIHSSAINHPPFIADSMSHTPPFIPARPSLASPGCQTRAIRFFFKGEAASC